MTARRFRGVVERPELVRLPLENAPVVVGFTTWAGTDRREDGLAPVVAATLTAIDATTSRETVIGLLFTEEAIRALQRSLTYSLRVARSHPPSEDDLDGRYDVTDAPGAQAFPASPK